MPRNAEVIRQWRLVQAIEAARHGLTVGELAETSGVTTRTIWRDVAALQEAGFPLYDEKIDNKTRWKLSAKPFKEMADSGFTLTQLCALYFSRTLLVCLAGTPFQDDLRAAFEKFERALPPRMRQFIDRLPSLLVAKSSISKKLDGARQRDVVARLLEATLGQRRAAMRYYSFASQDTKDYVIEPYRLMYAEGGMYLFAYVAAYGEVRTFAVERIKDLSLLEQTFERRPDVIDEGSAHSLGVHTGTPERIELQFAPEVAEYVRERQWHPSQRLTDADGRAVLMTLDVCRDYALRSWVLGFGPFVRVIAPAALADDILEQLNQARELYVPPAPTGKESP